MYAQKLSQALQPVEAQLPMLQDFAIRTRRLADVGVREVNKAKFCKQPSGTGAH